MTKIELTDLQRLLIQKQLKGEYSPFLASEEEQKAYNEIIDKAEALDEELGYEEYDDMIAWFWDKYKEQEGIA